MGHSKKDNSIVSEGSISGSAVEDQDDYAKLVSQLEHAKNQRAKEQRKVSELEQNVSLLIQVKINSHESIRSILFNTTAYFSYNLIAEFILMFILLFLIILCLIS